MTTKSLSPNPPPVIKWTNQADLINTGPVTAGTNLFKCAGHPPAHFLVWNGCFFLENQVNGGPRSRGPFHSIWPEIAPNAK